MQEGEIRTNEFRVVGPPGCGKTTWLGERVDDVVERGRRPMVTSLTKAAAAEISARKLPISFDCLGTLHSHCFHALGQPEIAEGREHIDLWNEENRDNWALSTGSSNAAEMVEEDNLEPVQQTKGDQLMTLYQIHRGRMTTGEMNPEVKLFAAEWQAFKEKHGLLDFTDLIEVCHRDVAEAPGYPHTMLVDEAQDLDLLEMSLIRKWGAACESLYIVGDPDQCQPAGTMVETREGPLPIEELQPERHHILTWDRHSQAVLGHRKDHLFQKAVREYRGDILTVRAGEKQTRCTPDHRWLVKWSNKDTKNCCTYLMRRGDRWRTGWCQVFNSEGTLHLGTRATIEKADEAWILSIHADRKDASVEESILAARYGLTTATFRPTHLTEERAGRIWESLDGGEQRERATRCLADHGRMPEHPVWKRGNGTQRVIARLHQMRACNLIPELMSVPSHDRGEKNHWETITEVQSEEFQGQVYSLRVEPHQTYVADGLVTHNCIFAWRGADPRAFTGTNIPEENRQVLSQSYRVPRAVHARAVRWINRIEGRERVQYQPRDHDGDVRQINHSWQDSESVVEDLQQYLERDMTVMLLTTCSFMLQPILKELRKTGTPFHNPFRRRNGAWNPLQRRRGQTSTADRILSFLRMSTNGGWTADDVNRWTEIVRVKGAMNQNSRKAVKQLLDDENGGVSWEDLMTVFTEEAVDAGLRGDLDWLREQLATAKRASAEFPMNIARERGLDALVRPPLVVPGTIHCSPGNEPVFTDTGWVRIENLDPTRHRLPGHHRNTNRMTWGGTNNPMTDGFAFEKSARHHRGKLAVIETQRSRTRVTPNHRLPVSLDETFCEKWCCYLMRRNDWWRIGLCNTAHRPHRPGGVSGRLETEQGDAGWILSVHETREEAVVAEAKWQGRYGIPGTTFRAAKSREPTDEQLSEIHESTKDSVGPRVTQLFEDTGLQEDQPLYTRSPQEGGAARKKIRENIFTTAAGNLTPLSGYIRVLVPRVEFLARSEKQEHSSPDQVRATVTLEEFDGTVYGLDVPPYHHYVSGGAVVHNSVKGGEADVVYVFPDISRAGMGEWVGGPEQQASVYRLFYVAMTRARDTLVFAQPVRNQRGYTDYAVALD